MKEEINAKRVGVLLDTTLLQYCETIDLIDDTSVCDSMFRHLLRGDLDREFISPKLNKVSPKIREQAFSIARKYGYLCFYEGNVNYWEDSVDGYSPQFPSELIAEKILDNYNFLIELAYEKGEEALKELVNLASSEIAEENAVVDYLRNNFDDQLLKNILSNTSKFKDLSAKEKSILYLYPKGVLYLEYNEKDSKDYMMISEEQLVQIIADFTNDYSIRNMSLKEVINYLGEDIFKSIIRDIHLSNNEKHK